MSYIVIYCDGKADAQHVLNELYKKYKSREGANITPRFNAHVTSLIYVAQGDGDDKKMPKNTYFELPYKIYFDPNYIDLVTKEQPYKLPEGQTYYLVHPETKQYLKNPGPDVLEQIK